MAGGRKDNSSEGGSRRGRPRSAAAREAILRAARSLLDEGGPGAVTMEAVAARAGVGKATVYRTWPDRHAVTMAALMHSEDVSPPSRRRSALVALRDQLETLVQRFSTPTGRYITSMLAAAERDTELSKAFRNHFVLTRREEGMALLGRAVAEGVLPGDTDVELLADLLYGPLFFRLLLGHGALDQGFVERLLDHVLRS